MAEIEKILLNCIIRYHIGLVLQVNGFPYSWGLIAKSLLLFLLKKGWQCKAERV